MKACKKGKESLKKYILDSFKCKNSRKIIDILQKLTGISAFEDTDVDTFKENIDEYINYITDILNKTGKYKVTDGELEDGNLEDGNLEDGKLEDGKLENREEFEYEKEYPDIKDIEDKKTFGENHEAIQNFETERQYEYLNEIKRQEYLTTAPEKINMLVENLSKEEKTKLDEIYKRANITKGNKTDGEIITKNARNGTLFRLLSRMFHQDKCKEDTCKEFFAVLENIKDIS